MYSQAAECSTVTPYSNTLSNTALLLSLWHDLKNPFSTLSSCQIVEHNLATLTWCYWSVPLHVLPARDHMVPYVLLVPLAAATLAASSHVPLPPASSTYNFLALADWGDDGAGQHAAAVGLGTIAASINAQSVYVLGDNFYSNGIRPEDGRDGMTRINRTFESVYTADSLRNIPFHVVAVNHDHN